MADAIITKFHGIKCDAPGCDYRDPSATLEDYEAWLDKPCPVCGANLLTAKDLAATKAWLAVVGLFNELAGPVPDDAPRGEEIHVYTDGSGMPKFRWPS